MMRRIIMLVTVALVMAAMLVGSALPALAAHSQGQGTPNEKACQGVVIGGLAHSKIRQLPPPKAIESGIALLSYPSVKDYIQGARDGDFGVRSSVTGELTICHPDEGQ
jgi:hypothetical protein